MSENRKSILLRFRCVSLSFFLRCHGSLGRQRKQQAGFQGDVLTGIAELEKMFDGSLPSKNGESCPAVSAARTFLVAQNITLQFARVYFVPLFPLARIFCWRLKMRERVLCCKHGNHEVQMQICRFHMCFVLRISSSADGVWCGAHRHPCHACIVGLKIWRVYSKKQIFSKLPRVASGCAMLEIRSKQI